LYNEYDVVDDEYDVVDDEYDVVDDEYDVVDEGGSDAESVLMCRHLFVQGLVAESGCATKGSRSDWAIVYN
jgi:hypothetical protein